MVEGDISKATGHTWIPSVVQYDAGFEGFKISIFSYT